MIKVKSDSCEIWNITTNFFIRKMYKCAPFYDIRMQIDRHIAGHLSEADMMGKLSKSQVSLLL